MSNILWQFHFCFMLLLLLLLFFVSVSLFKAHFRMYLTFNKQQAVDRDEAREKSSFMLDKISIYF